jgi:hypothetical protein
MAAAVFRRICPEVNPDHSLEIPILESAFREVGDLGFVKACCVEFAEARNFPEDGPFTPLYLRLGYREDERDPRGYRFQTPHRQNPSR